MSHYRPARLIAPIGSLLCFTLWLFVHSSVWGLAPPTLLTNAAFASEANRSPLTDTPTVQLYLPLVVGPPPAQLLIAAAYIDSTVSGEPDEAILLWNIGPGSQLLAGWQLATSARQVTFPVTTTLQLQSGQRVWCTAQATAFRASFGTEPACEWATDSDPTVPNLAGKLTLPNSGGRIQLLNPAGQVVDTLLYGDEQQPANGWVGPATQLYTRGLLAAAGQIWQRKIDPESGLPIDNNRASDWAGDLADLALGRRVRLPGWRGWGREDLAWPVTGVATTSVTVLVGPEGLYQPLAQALAAATHSIDLNIYQFAHRELAQVIADAAQRGVHVRILLEGSPPGGIDALQKWSLALIAAAGGEVRYAALLDDAPNGYRARYRFDHAKYGIIDQHIVIEGSENFTYESMPITQTVPVGGRRGFYLITDAPPVLTALTQIFTTDWAPEHFLDLHPFEATHAKYGGPPTDFVFPALTAYPVKTSPFRTPVTISGAAHFSVISAPENALRSDAGLNALIRRTGAGDEIVLEQLYENKNWGETTSNPVADPNPRLQALIEAARRGVRVRLLLDSFFDEPETLRSNRATVDYIRTLAAAEKLDIEAKVGNPTLGGIHAKLVLVAVGAERWSAVGSLNGGETSYKLNREVVVMTDLAGVYERLAQVFAWDWAK
ncbi:MAG: phospholipase D-like domain-containing protein [Chloroflexi bacterium]|nr:phospholipase D-like domain-containing protein [Chloroflexota bacterium]